MSTTKRRRPKNTSTGDLVQEAIRDKPHAANRRRLRELELARRLAVADHRIDRMSAVAQRMSNLCFNLGQAVGRSITAHDAESMRELAREWDAASRAPEGRPA